MTRYTGNGAYGYANSVHMVLRASGAAPAELPEPGFIECLTTIPFGTLYLRVGRDLLVYFSSPLATPDQGITTALDALGWECREEREGTAEAAIERLAEAAGRGPVLAGPLDMGGLGYMPHHAQLSGSDHFVVVLGVEHDRVRMHDPRFVLAPLWLIPIALLAWAIPSPGLRPPRGREAIALGILAAALIVTAMTLARGRMLRPIISYGDGPLGTQPVPRPTLVPFRTRSGLQISRPQGGDQCWQAYLCTPNPVAGLQLRGRTVASGFRVDR